MDLILEILSVFLSAALLENMVFGRALGVSRTTLVQEKRADVVAFSLSVLFMCTVSSVLGYGIRWLLGWPKVEITLFAKQAILFLAVVISYCLLYLLVIKKLKALASMFGSVVSYAAFNGAVYGSLLVSTTKELGLWQSLVHGFGAGCGMILASALILTGHRRLDIRNVPRAFRGMPIMLMYIGILALALYGLVGHNLPT
ncbi:MAG: hypothetical protein IJY02_05490 [Oscillospiraceae bacterium]|nr:hypothetical protein [Oscillospiraceae bacterium]